MNRRYDKEKYLALAKRIKEEIPDIALTTDIIVGFPGEELEDFALTESLFHEARFDMAYVFRYSVRKGAPAEPLGDPIPESEKDRRDKVLLAILEKYSMARNQSLVGTVQEVLVEGPAKRGESMFQGKNNGDRRVIFKGDDSLLGALVRVKIESATVTALTGTLLEVISK